MDQHSTLLRCFAAASIAIAGCSKDVSPPNTSSSPTKLQETDSRTSSANGKPNGDQLTPAKPTPLSAESALSKELFALLRQIDELGRAKLQDAKYVEVKVQNQEQPDHEVSQHSWLIEESEESLTLLQDDLIPWVYSKKSATTIPSSWQPAPVQLKSIAEVDFESTCKRMIKLAAEPEDELERMRRSFRAPGPSRRLLVAHAAWKKGLTNYCERIVSLDPQYSENFEEYRKVVLEDLAWLHLLRGVNLLMFADRREALPHFHLVSQVSPEGEFAAQAKDLAKHMERLIATEAKDDGNSIDETRMNESEKAEFYISQLKNIQCVQFAQPGFISPYMAVIDGKPEDNPPTKKLMDMGMSAVPALITALEDDTPTRTIYHWRDFHRSRRVWRVSDFAWTILRDITKKDFGDRRVVGFTLGSMPPPQKRIVIDEIKQWYEHSKNQTPDDRMFAFFSSHKPEDWMTAGRYFLKKKDKRAVKPLLEQIPRAGSFRKGELCELVAEFGDASAKPVIQDVLKTGTEASDRLSAAIALWELGDGSGVPVVIEYVKAEKQPYGSWDEPVWFLLWSHTKEGIETLKSVVMESPPDRAGEVAGFILTAITGDLWGEERKPAGCVEICPVLIAAMERDDYTGGSINDIRTRIKDSAAKSLVLLRQGVDERFGGRFTEIDPKLFNELEPDESERDSQIEMLKDWYGKNKSKLVWDAKQRRLAIKDD